MHSQRQPIIHQFAIDITPGDGISNGMLLTRKLLRLAGVHSEIYCAEIPPGMQGDILPMSDYCPGSAAALLVHHGIGNPQEGWLRSLPERKFMVFHNITPGELFPADHPIQPMLAHGWAQVSDWKDWLAGSIADSRQNLDELLQRGYSAERLAEIPLLVDLERLAPQTAGLHDAPRPFTLLFVGRVMPHKNQMAIVEAFACLCSRACVPLRLDLVGGFTVPEYRDQLLARIRELGLENHIRLTGKVDDATLAAHYRNSDLFVCLSRHEGFGMPLIEAMVHGLPVLAYNAPASNIEHTLAGAGLLLDNCQPEACAAAIAQLMDNPALRRHLRLRGRQRLQEFTYQNLYDRLRTWLGGFGIHLPEHRFPAPAVPQPLDYRIEGPFDSSYSLALVNRELARALAAEGHVVALRATEGPGTIVADPGFLAANPDCAALQLRGEQPARNVLRLLYPPRVTGMRGDLDVLSCYGWEESCLPQPFCQDFNQHLHLITSMSSWVTRTLQDNGVSVPLVTVGLGADHILRVPADASLLPVLPAAGGERLKFLHISSCFPRKGVDVLLTAYARAFSARDAVVLILKTFPNPHHDIVGQLAEWRQAHPDAPAVELINQDLPDPAIRALYQLADVLVAPSRGEGFGLPLAEAMLHRCPVIATARGGQADFCREDTAWLIDCRYARAQSHLQGGASVWFEPDVEHLAELLCQFHQAFVAGRLAAFVESRVSAAEALIRQRFTWQQVARVSDQAIVAAENQPLLKPAPRLGCITTWNSACGIATYSRELLGPAFGEECTILANDDAQLTAADAGNVVRCWTAGMHDDLGGLRAAIDRSGVDTLLIQFNFSFFSLQSFAALLDWAHDRDIRTLVTFHSTADVYHGEELKSLRALRPALARSARLLVHSVADLNRLHDFGLRDNLLLFPHGVLQVAPPQPGPRQLAAGLQGRTVIASYGFLLPHKGIPELIEAFAELACEHRDLHLLLVNAEYPVPASAELAAACRRRIADPDLAGRVTLISDYLEDADSLAWLALADCIVFPYQHTQESSSAAVRWGLCTGKPVLCTPLEIFEDVADAVTFLPGTGSADLAAGLRACLARWPEARQGDWLRTHAWPVVSVRLRNLLVVLATKA
jgi:glycosyltransferase involved in cell wall biosynthesis